MFTVSCDKDSVTNPDDVPVSVTESELKEAFYYTFPLMIMDATESVETNTETFVPGIPRAPVNQLIHAVKLADASNKSVVTPNVDTYYSRLWMDMNEEPVVFEFPDVKDRFCNIQVLDAWTNTTKAYHRWRHIRVCQEGTDGHCSLRSHSCGNAYNNGLVYCSHP